MSESEIPGEPQEQAGAGHLPPVETRFKPGVSGNPGGRPRGSSILAPILRKLAANPNEHGEGEEAVKLANKAILGAQAGEDISGVLKLLERTDGAIEKTTNMNVRAVVEGIELIDRRPAKAAPEAP